MLASPWESDLALELLERFSERGIVCRTYLSQNYAEVPPEVLLEVLSYLKDKVEFDTIVDITAVDHPKRDARFDLVYTVYSHPRNERLRIKALVPEGFQPQSAVPVWGGANWLEREIFDMFGIRFEGHPDLRRILLPDEWTGHPLRKDKSILDMDQKWVQEHVGIESGQ